MSWILPDTQMGPLASILLWIGLALVVVVALFTTGMGPILVAIVPVFLIVAILFIAGRRLKYRLTRGRR